MKLNIFAALSLLITAVFAQGAKQAYIVGLQKGTILSTAIDAILKLISTVTDPIAAPSAAQQWSAGDLVGFTTSMTPGQARILQASLLALYVEPDGQMKVQGHLTRFSKRTLQTQSPGVWGLGRVSHHASMISSYVYDSTAGQNTCVYIIDSGINTAHVEFGTRATFVQNWVSTESNTDLSGHGTAVAGVVGATTFGVAKLSNLYSMKVCDQNGNCAVSSVVAAIAATMNDSPNKPCHKGVVINLSLGGLNAGWSSVSQAVVSATNAGILVVSAAGNDGANAANYLPASAAGSCTVGATDVNDAKPSWSNWGNKLAVFAPGVNVQSTYIGSSNTATAYFDGTSMAAPHVAGLGAYLNSLNGKTNPNTMCNNIKTTATMNIITGLTSGGQSGSPNKLAYNGNGA
ncbi:hypothetical protein EG328_002124 [Venturia inaequalis]|uniref:Peptidase S8/S53 domain-containing protein n=1 Tax=Venturia inaequalis TaxID=5025 RepID=A0A8H3UX08_VENIN|nr:hypothetical protein EG328_002124 [Venturia inaequalis]